jgi:pimeloyl-ACP methyl ester carboxylesterase
MFQPAINNQSRQSKLTTCIHSPDRSNLMFDYRTNVAAYPLWQEYLCRYRPPTLVVLGKYDDLFTVDGALAFGRDVPDAEIYLLNAGHFALDEEAGAIAALIRRFLRARLISL